MASDISTVLKESQTVIDNAVKTVTETIETQRVLKENIVTTDKKIGVHDHSVDSHEDLRLILADQPAMITEPVIAGPSAVETGEENSWVISAAGVIPTVSINTFSVTDNKGNKFSVPADSNGQGTFTHVFIGERDEQIQLTVRAHGTFNFVSKDVKYPILITKHAPPDLTNLVHTIPARASYGKTYSFSISGITDTDSDLTDISVQFDPTKLSFTKSTGLTQGLNYSFTVFDTAKGGTTNITIVATDARGLNNSLVVPVALNSDPSLAGLNHTIPAIILKDSTVTCRVNGVTDIDGDTVTFSIASDNPALIFSKSTGLAMNESFTVTALANAAIPAATITLTFNDGIGGSAVATINSKISLPPSVKNFVVTQPDRYLPGQSTTISFAGATDDDGNPTKYSITNTYPDLVFSKTANIDANEAVNITVSNAAVAGTIYPITVNAVDTIGATTPVTISVRINTPPNISGLTTDISARSIPGKQYTWFISGLTDTDVQAVTYSVTSTNPDVILEDNIGRASGQSFKCTVPTEAKLSRGESFTLKVAVTDGLETVERMFTVIQNKLIDDTNFTCSIPTRLVPGATVPVSMYGAVDNDGEQLQYSIAYRDSNVCSFSKYTGITENEVVNFTVTSNATRGLISPITVRITDTAGEYVEKIINCTVNSLPDISGLTHTVPTILKPNTAYTDLQVGGITDVDNDIIHVTVTADNGVAIGNGTAIALDGKFSLTTPPVSTLGRGSSFTVTFAVTDGHETVTTTRTFKINTVPDITPIAIALPAKVKPNFTYTEVSFTPATDNDAQDVKYTFVPTKGVSVTPSMNLLQGATFDVSIPDTATLARGDTFDIVVLVDDGSEVVEKTLTFAVRQTIDMSQLSMSIPEYVIPGTPISDLSVQQAISPDGLIMTYTVTSSNADVVISSAPNAAINTTFSITSPTEDKLARGQSFDVTISITDGIEAVSRQYTCKQNVLPDIAAATIVVPDTMKGGTENAVSFSISGAVDADSGLAPTYVISDIVGPLTFSKSTGIGDAEIVAITSSKVTESTACSFSVQAQDIKINELTAKRTVNISIEPIIVTAAPTITYPVNNDNYVPNTGFTMTFTEYASEIWTGEGPYPNN